MDFIKAFHIDNGRKYFSPEELKKIIDVMEKNGYNQLELSIGNDGMRFLLDDMSVMSKGKVYDSDDVKKAIENGNRKYCDSGANELTEKEMNDIISHACERGIKIIPLFDTPGHMNTIISAMEELGISDVRYKGSETTIDFDNEYAVDFTREFISKYVSWFSKNGSEYFNIGCDEYANDVLKSGFASLEDPDNFKYNHFIDYVNSIAKIVTENGLKPIMFNDGMYYNSVTEGGLLSKEIICSYWSKGWEGYTPASASFIEKNGHRILNTAEYWYYVLGHRPNPEKYVCFTNESSVKGISEVGLYDVPGGIEGSPIGAMFCFWCDEPQAPYSKEEEEFLLGLIEKFGKKFSK